MIRIATERDGAQINALAQLIPEKVWVKEDEITAITPRPSYHRVVAGLMKVVDDVDEKEKTIQKDKAFSRWLSGSDGADCSLVKSQLCSPQHQNHINIPRASKPPPTNS